MKRRRIKPRTPTERQLEYVAAVRALSRELGHAPSVPEVARRAGVSDESARQQLLALERMGLLRDVPKLVRSGQWAVTIEGEAYVPRPDLSRPLDTQNGISSSSGSGEATG